MDPEEVARREHFARIEEKLKLAKNFDPHAVEDSELYKLNEATLVCPSLESHMMYKKLRIRLNAFYVAAEKYRLTGPTEQQKETFRKTGYSFPFRV